MCTSYFLIRKTKKLILQRFPALPLQISSCASLFLSFLTLPPCFLSLSCKFIRHYITPLILLKARKADTPDLEVNSTMASQAPNEWELRSMTQNFTPPAEMTPSAHFLPSAFLPWSMSLTKWKLHQLINHTEKLKMTWKSSNGWRDT